MMDKNVIILLIAKKREILVYSIKNIPLYEKLYINLQICNYKMHQICYNIHR
jgi:hypothetical protein